MENTAKDQNKRKKQRAHCSQNIHHKHIEKRKKQAILHKKYCSLIHQNVLYKIRTLESNSQCTCRNQGQTDEKKTAHIHIANEINDDIQEI